MLLRKTAHLAFAAGLLLPCAVSNADDNAGLVYEDTAVVDGINGAYTATKSVQVCYDPVCPGTPGASCCDNGKIASLTMRYTGESCGATSTSQPDDKWDCTDFSLDPLPDTVYIIASKDSGCGGDIYFEGTVNAGDVYVIDASAALGAFTGGAQGAFGDKNSDPKKPKNSLPDGGLALGVPTLPSTTHICIFDMQGGALLQTVKFHTSCSQPLFQGDQFGANLVVDCVGEDEGQADKTDCCQNGNPVVVTMEYTGSACDFDANDQGDKFKCEQAVPGDLPNTVYVVVAKDPCDSYNDDDIYFQGTVSVGDTFDVDATVIGEDKLKSKTFFCYYDMEGGTLLQEVEMHTSCSAPIRLGDGYGAAELVGCIGENGPVVPPRDPCDPFPNDGMFTYTYEICNDAGSALGLIAWEVLVDSGVVADAGVLAGGGVVPSAVTIESNRVEFDFFDAAIAPGECSALLYIVSPLGPDFIPASISGMAALDTPTECVGPAVECEQCESSRVCFTCPGLLGGGECPPVPEDCCVSGRPAALTLLFTGDGCGASSNSQDDGKWSCDDYGAIPDPAYVVVAKKPCDEYNAGEIYFEGSLNHGDEFDVFASAIGNDKFDSNTYVCVYDAPGGNLVQEVKFHTSCSTPLFTRDQFGSIQVLDCVSENALFNCSSKITELSMMWDGADCVTVRAWRGDIGDTLLLTADVCPGEVLTVGGYEGAPNNNSWEIVGVGESVFHLSCSDDEMDGPEDCGTNQGNGKDNDAGLINDWILVGLAEEDGGVLECP